MKRLYVIAPLLLALAAAGQDKTAYIVLVLSTKDAQHMAVADGFRSEFPGQFREINLEGSDLKLKATGQELKASKPTLAVLVGDQAVQMAGWHLEGVPLVYCDSPRADGILASSDGVAGVFYQTEPAKQLETMALLFPGRKRVGLFYARDNSRLDLESVMNYSRGLDLEVEPVALGSIKELPGELQEHLTRVDILWVVTDPEVMSRYSIEYLVVQSITARVPVFCGDNVLAASGAAAALVPDPENAGKKAAAAAGRMLRNEAPGPVSTVYPAGDLVLNKRIAGILGISFPQEAEGRAAKIIE
jgi:ABC-type uncharacterized transport system substrate-binding protein